MAVGHLGFGANVLQATPETPLMEQPLPTVAKWQDTAAQWELSQAIIEKFRPAGVSIPCPQREVRLSGAAAKPQD